jgi:ribosomal protein S11
LQPRERGREKFGRAVGVLGKRGVGVHVRRDGSGKGSKAVRKGMGQASARGREVKSRGSVAKEAHNGCKGKAKRRL